MASARGHGVIVYCLNSGSDDIQTGRHNGEKKKVERGALPWMEKKGKACPGWRKHERRALVGTDWKRAPKKRT
ncbi:hypothetical protein TNCV_4091141 [Trichonephila clavipes]|nr:hypothetical protein TNCV_4091141 [Trichonephila clavipes]